MLNLKIIKRIASILTIVLVTFTSCSQKVNEFYISPSGNDLNSGSIADPFLTIEKARDAVRTLLKTDSTQTITVYLREGDYFVENTIHFDERDGSKNGRIVYKGYKEEKVVINGGVPIIGWEKWKDNVYRAKVPKVLTGKPFYRLFDNSKSAVIARHPNVGDGFGGGLKAITNTTIKVPEEWNDYDFSTAQIYGWLGADWFSELRAVQSFNKADGILTINAGSQHSSLNKRIYVQGVLELLDAENEWCIKDDYVYYYPVSKTDINQRQILAPTKPRIIEVKGKTPELLVENISFENIIFHGSDFTNSWEISMPEDQQNGLMYIENAKNISIKFCQIIGAGHSAIFINKKSESCTVYGCSISYAGFCGIYANGFPVGHGGFENAKASYVNKGHNFSNNFIHHCGFSIGLGSGIKLVQSGDNNICHNVICKMARYGISSTGMRNGALLKNIDDKRINYENHFDFVHSRNNYIAYNEIYNVCRSSSDFGAIQSWGPGKDNVWNCNAIHDIDQPLGWDGWAHGLFTDDGSDFVTLKNNIVYELKGGRATGAVMVKSVNETVTNNIFADNAIGRVATLAPYAEPAKNNLVHKNIFFQSGKMLYEVNTNSLGTDFYGYYENDYNKEYVKGKKAFDEVDFNLIYPNYEQLDSLKKYGWDANSLIADPLFDKKHEQWDVTYFDYALKPGSPAHEIGFKEIQMDSIGLLNDFPFKTDLHINAGSTIQAEDYNRMHGMRSIGSTGIYKMEKGAWAKYDQVNFGNGLYGKFIFNWEEQVEINADESLFEIRLNSPNGKLIGKIYEGDKEVNIEKTQGIHNLFLVFQQEIMLNNFRFTE